MHIVTCEVCGARWSVRGRPEDAECARCTCAAHSAAAAERRRAEWDAMNERLAAKPPLFADGDTAEDVLGRVLGKGGTR